VVATLVVAAHEIEAAATTATAATQALAGSRMDRKLHKSEVPGVATEHTVR
jgi:hypothetical protein